MVITLSGAHFFLFFALGKGLTSLTVSPQSDVVSVSRMVYLHFWQRKPEAVVCVRDQIGVDITVRISFLTKFICLQVGNSHCHQTFASLRPFYMASS